MSQENVEIVGRVMDAWNRRDVDAMLALCGPRGQSSTSISSGNGGGGPRGQEP